MKKAPRVVIIGNSGVGKTSMVQQMSFGEFDKLNAPTVGAGVTPITVFVNGESIVYHVWDTAGQETFRTIVPLYFRDAVCAMIVFSLADIDSFNSLDDWLDLLYQNVPTKIPVILVANKSDIPNPSVEEQKAREWAENNGAEMFITSAATGQGIHPLFEYCGTVCMNCENEEDVNKVKETSEKKKCC